MRSHWWRLRRFTPKSFVLVMLGGIFTLLGVNGITHPWTHQQAEALVMLAAIAPRWVWGGLSIVAGLGSVLSSMWPTWNDTWGFVALGGMSAWWACAYVSGVVVTGSMVGISSALIWGGFCAMLWAISRLDDPYRPEQP